ncbi:MAG: NUDIX domain-containing protein [Bauldia sp.]|nr:NUDIX domain-containing protein [Bauldia sp.]
MTLGVRAAVFDGDSVLLVRHSYVPGWYFPGGGVDPGETVAEAVRRELHEEAGVALTGEPELFGFYLNRIASVRDHVALFLCPAWTPAVAHQPSREIVEAGFFPLDRLPEGTTNATRRRLDEIAGAVVAAEW